jgi:hypothetical protein
MHIIPILHNSSLVLGNSIGGTRMVNSVLLLHVGQLRAKADHSHLTAEEKVKMFVFFVAIQTKLKHV